MSEKQDPTFLVDQLKKLLDEKATELKEAEDRFSYRFGGKTWLSKAPPSEYKKVFSDLFEMCAVSDCY